MQSSTTIRPSSESKEIQPSLTDELACAILSAITNREWHKEIWEEKEVFVYRSPHQKEAGYNSILRQIKLFLTVAGITPENSEIDKLSFTNKDHTGFPSLHIQRKLLIECNRFQEIIDYLFNIKNDINYLNLIISGGDLFAFRDKTTYIYPKANFAKVIFSLHEITFLLLNEEQIQELNQDINEAAGLFFYELKFELDKTMNAYKSKKISPSDLPAEWKKCQYLPPNISLIFLKSTGGNYFRTIIPKDIYQAFHNIFLSTQVKKNKIDLLTEEITFNLSGDYYCSRAYNKEEARQFLQKLQTLHPKIRWGLLESTKTGNQRVSMPKNEYNTYYLNHNKNEMKPEEEVSIINKENGQHHHHTSTSSNKP